MLARTLLGWTLLSALTACTPAGEQVVNSTDGKKCGATGTNTKPSAASLVGEEPADEVALAATKEVTWVDVKEILSSASGKRIYKCAFCHPNYAKMESINNKDAFNSMMVAIDRSVNPKATMPVGGEMQAADIVTLRAWESGGFKEKPTAVAATTTTAAAASATSTDCK